MASVVVKHNLKTNALPNPAVLVDGSTWDNDPHVVTGLDQIDNTSDVNKPVSIAQAAAIASEAALARNAVNLTSGTIPAARLPNPTAATLGGVESIAAVAHQFLTAISTAGVPAQAQPAFSDISGSVAATQMPALTGDVTMAAGATATVLGKTHLVTYTVAPSGASASDKLRADFIGNGTSDQTAVVAAVAAAKAVSSYSKVIMLPGVYWFTAAADISGGNGFAFEASGTQVNGPGVQTSTLSALDTFIIQNSNSARFKFGSIVTNSTGAAIHSLGGYIETEITWQSLDGTARNGYGILIDSRIALGGQGQSVNWLTGTHVENFNVGIALLKDGGTGANIDTYRVTADFIFNNNKGVYVNSSAGNTINANVWNINIDASHNAGDVAFQTNGLYDEVNAIIGGLAAGSHNFVLDSGAVVYLNLTPVPLAATAGSIVDNSGNTLSTINGSSVDGFLNGAAQLVKYSINGQLVRTGLTLGTIGAVNTLSWFSATGVWSSLATANSGVLVTDGSGVPSISATLPSGLTIPAPTFTGAVAASGPFGSWTPYTPVFTASNAGAAPTVTINSARFWTIGKTTFVAVKFTITNINGNTGQNVVMSLPNTAVGEVALPFFESGVSGNIGVAIPNGATKVTLNFYANTISPPTNTLNYVHHVCGSYENT